MNEYSFSYRPMLNTQPMTASFSYGRPWLPKCYSFKYGRLSTVNDADYMSSPEAFTKTASGLFFSNEFLSWLGGPYMSMCSKSEGFGISDAKSSMNAENQGVLLEDAGHSMKDFIDTVWTEQSRGNRRMIIWRSVGEFLFNDYSHYGSFLSSEELASSYKNKEVNDGTYVGSSTKGKTGYSFKSYIGTPINNVVNIIENIYTWRDDPVVNMYLLEFASSKNTNNSLYASIYEQLNFSQQGWYDIGKVENTIAHKTVPQLELGFSSEHAWKVPFKTSPGPDVLTPWKKSFKTNIYDMLEAQKFFQYWSIYENVSAAPPDATRHIIWNKEPDMMAHRPVPRLLIMDYESTYKYNAHTNFYDNFMAFKPAAKVIFNPTLSVLRDRIYVWVNDLESITPPDKIPYLDKIIFGFKYDYDLLGDNNFEALWRDKYGIIISNERIANAFKDIYRLDSDSGLIIHKINRKLIWDSHPWTLKYGSDKAFEYGNHLITKPLNSIIENTYDSAAKDIIKAFFLGYDEIHKLSGDVGSINEVLLGERTIYSVMNITTEHASIRNRELIYQKEVYAVKYDLECNAYDYLFAVKDNNVLNNMDQYFSNVTKSIKITLDNSAYYSQITRSIPKIWLQSSMDAINRHRPDVNFYETNMAYRRNPHVNWFEHALLSYKSKFVVNAPMYMLFGRRHINEIYRFTNAFEEISKSMRITNELSPFKMATRPIIYAWPYKSFNVAKKYKPILENISDWAYVPFRNVMSNLQEMAMRPIREAYDNMWSSVFALSSGILMRGVFESGAFNIHKSYKNINDNGIIDALKMYKDISESSNNTWLHKTVPDVFTTDIEGLWKRYADVLEYFNGASIYKVNIDSADFNAYSDFIGKKNINSITDKYDEFVLKQYISTSDFKLESCVFIYKKYVNVMIPDKNGTFVYRTKGESTTLGEFIHEWVTKTSVTTYGGNSGLSLFKLPKDAMDQYIGCFANKSEIYSTGLLNGLSIFKTPTDTYGGNNGVFADKPPIDVSVYNEEHAQVLKKVRDVMLENYFVGILKPSQKLMLHDDVFAYKEINGVSISDEDFAYKKTVKVFAPYQDWVYKISKKMYANTSAPLWTDKVSISAFTQLQEWVQKNARRIWLEAKGTFAGKEIKPVALSDKEIDLLVKDKVDVAIWQKVQGHDFVGVYKGGKDVYTQDDNIFVIDKARDVLVKRQCFASVVGKSISLFDQFIIFCDKDSHSVFLQAENVWCQKGKKTIMSDRIGEWLIDGKRSIITDIELEFASKGKKEITVNPSIHTRKKKKPIVIDPFQSWVNKMPKSMSLFNGLDWGDKYKRLELFSQEFVVKDKKSTLLFTQEWLEKTFNDVFVCDSNDFFKKNIHGFTNAGEFVKRMNSFKVRVDQNFEQFDTNKIASIITVEREADGFNEKFLIPVEKLAHNALYQEIDSMIKKYAELHLDKDDFGAWAWVYEYPNTPFDDPYEKGGIDELLLPEQDVRYENFEDVIFNKQLNRPRNPIKKIDDNTWICKFPTKHPFKEFHEEDGNRYVGVVDGNYFGVDVGIMRKIYLKYYEIWQQNIFRFATMTMMDASKLMLEYLYSWIMLYFPAEDMDQALRIFRQVRWFSESAVINNSQYIVSGEWEDMKMLDIPNDLDDNDTMYYDPKTVTIRNSPSSLDDECYVEFYIDAWKNTVFSFSIVNTVGNVKVYIDDKRVDIISKTRRVNKYPITYTGETTVVRIEKDATSNINTMFMLADIRVEGLKFGTLNVEFDPKLKAGNKPLSIVADKMMRFANLYDDVNAAYEDAVKANLGISVTVEMMEKYYELHHKGKNKGKRLMIKKI